MTDLPHQTVKGKHGSAGFELAPEVLNSRNDIALFLRTRRSTVAADITAPGPDDAQLAHIMEAACRVPDHGKLTPWRFILFQGAGREAFADWLTQCWRQDNAGATTDAPVPEANFVRNVPLVIAAIFSPVDHPRIPAWEQQLSTGAACLNLLNAAIAMGFAAQWRSGWPAYHAQVAEHLGLGPHERIAGFIYIGTRRADATPMSDRRRPFWQDRTSHYAPADKAAEEPA